MSDSNSDRSLNILRDETTTFQIPLKIDFVPESDWRFNLYVFVKKAISLVDQGKVFERISETLLHALPVFAVDKKTLDNIFSSQTLEISVHRKKFPRFEETLAVSISFYGYEALIDLSGPRTRFSMTFHKANEVERFPRTPEWNQGEIPLKFLFDKPRPKIATFVMQPRRFQVLGYQHCFVNVGYGDEVGVERHGPTAVEVMVYNHPV